MADERYRPAQESGIHRAARGLIKPSHPAVQKNIEIVKSTDVGDALIASRAIGEHRKSVPKRIFNRVIIAGISPAANYNLNASGAVPDGQVFHIHTILHDATQGDPNIAGCTGISAVMYVLIDEEPVFYSEIRTALTSIVALAAFEFSQRKVFPVCYYAAEDSVISAFLLTQYLGGGAAARMEQSVTVLGDLIELSEDLMGRGTGQTLPATAAGFGIAGNKYAL